MGISRWRGEAPTHPAQILAEALDDCEIAPNDAARMLKVDPARLAAVLAETAPIDRDLAARVGKFLGNGPAIYLRMQAAHDTWHAERADVSAVETLPVRELEG